MSQSSIYANFPFLFQLSDVFVVEHGLGLSNIKFGLRKRNAGNVSENTIIFKADNEKTQKRWVKKLREFTVNIQHNHESTKKAGGSTSTLGSGSDYRSFRSPHPTHTSSTSRPSSTAESTSSNRNSRSSRDSCEIPPPHVNGHLPPNGLNPTTHHLHPTAAAPGANNNCTSDVFHDSECGGDKDNHVGFRLSQWPKE